MADEAKAWWEANAREFQEMVQLPIAVIYGTHVTEEKLQLIGAVAGKQLLEIGCGGAQCGIADEVGYAFAENRRTVSDFSSALVGAETALNYHRTYARLGEPCVSPISVSSLTKFEEQRWAVKPCLHRHLHRKAWAFLRGRS